ncbi:LysE/ArgO family amino acid transporter [Seohaeicola zhoushanensis]|uniref:Amino acid transporter n=1 Tax=Seohaeicola zhoushanensis TaxID=1569283 RepID=A0A8J3GYN3_9RHOB|nr:LysE/ArgO family amino acid transporter [Seohaeicola zhoushanensis]GHF51921.1 amino acid transporter [Seohaeicola zhoushanensis]
MFTAALSGFLLGFSLILAIGAQNSFVLRQGLRGEHVLAVCLTCALSDAALIAAGVAGFGALAEGFPLLLVLMRWGGVAFLVVYGLLSLRRAASGASALAAGGPEGGRLSVALLMVLGFTWLNPHVYLDTLVLVGSVAAQSAHPAVFGAGAVVASFTFFFALGYGARLLAPLFARPRAWQFLDAGIGVTMFAIAARLVAM